MNATKARVIVKKIANAMNSQGGIILRSPTDHPRAVAVSVGPDVRSGIKSGNVLVIDWSRCGRFEYLEQEYFIIHEHDIMAIIE